jgi:hypothetical protein
MSEERFVWGKNHILWHANRTAIAGWVDNTPAGKFWYARTAGTVTHPVVRAEFDNLESARDFLMFIANAENTYD